MRCRIRHRHILPLILALASPAVAQAQQREASPTASRREVALEVRQVVEQLQTLRADRRRVEQSHADAVERLQRQIDRLEADVDRVNQLLADQEQAIQTQSDAREQAREQQVRLSQLLGQVRDAAEPVVERMRGRVASGIAFQREQRVAELDRVAEGLADAHPTAWAGAAQSLWEFAADELEAGRSIDLTNRPIHLDGGQRREQAWVLRLGLAGAVFVTEDESEVGVASASTNEPWQIASSVEMREAVVQAVRIRRNLAPPALVNLPYTVPASAGSTPQEADR